MQQVYLGSHLGSHLLMTERVACDIPFPLACTVHRQVVLDRNTDMKTLTLKVRTRQQTVLNPPVQLEPSQRRVHLPHRWVCTRPPGLPAAGPGPLVGMRLAGAKPAAPPGT